MEHQRLSVSDRLQDTKMLRFIANDEQHHHLRIIDCLVILTIYITLVRIMQQLVHTSL